MLEQAGFEEVVRAGYDATTIPELRLNESQSRAVRAKLHRRFYSVYVEATKPAAGVPSGGLTRHNGKHSEARMPAVETDD